ncbi:beta-galactosidase GalA [Pontiella agarivorans]|uniref:Beta-galactosidase GalA n=1 Tax=Pontiella agarivorans TaxID=3038953 RepID=A0ABU5N1V8_9BACT|nr:beta-galactosidase GalA [Pontiella agarivorans]MDZ8120433.1 beta-galactosidase GalA [Pontiella agarivorans]
MREILSMNPGWRFIQQDVKKQGFQSIHETLYANPAWMKSGNHGLSEVGYNDLDWQPVDLPHDFLQENPFTPDAEVGHGSIQKGIGWYRKTFVVPASDEGRRIRLEFDGIFRDSEVWINGHFLHRHLSGYTSFPIDASDVLNYGKHNVIAVRCDANLPELWSYEGGGIYRDVRLVKTHPVHVPYSGIFVHTENNMVKIETAVRNDLDTDLNISLQSTIINAEDHAEIVNETDLKIEAENTATGFQTLELSNPRNWHPDDPYLYTLVTSIRIEGEIVDEVRTPFGIKDVRFDGKKGFFLNGKPLKIRGICNHQDHAGVGTAIPDALQEWRMIQMKNMGVNALRCAHNPPTPALLDICDRLGIMVMDETRLTGSSPELLQQLEDLIKRDRNHASIIMWSLGNEEMKVQSTNVGIKQLKKMQHLVHRLDPTRPAVYSMNCNWLSIARFHDSENFHLDVFGANYTLTPDGVDDGQYDKFHERYPDWPIIGSETGGSFATRGLYDTEYYNGKPMELNDFGHGGICWENEHLKGMASAYNNGLTPWGSTIDQTWKACADRDFLAATFLWTGFDYRGETYPFDWPATVTRFGLMDLCGFPKDAYFYYKAWWNTEPLLHLFPHWNWAGKEGLPIKVRAYTNCAEVELVLNGKTLTRQPVETNGYFETMADYQPGRLEAIGYDTDGKEILRTVNETVGDPAAIRLTAEADGTFVVKAEIMDAEGRFVPTASNKIRYTIEGDAGILGTGNGNPTSHEPPKGTESSAFFGLSQAIVQMTGEKAVLRAEADGLESAEVELRSSHWKKPPHVPGILEKVEPIEIAWNPVDGIL